MESFRELRLILKSILPLALTVSIATGSQMAGRLANVAISLLVVAAVGATAQTDLFFLIIAVSFYFYGVLANAISQATVPLIISRTLCLKPGHVAACGCVTAMVVAAAAFAVDRTAVPIALPYIAAMGLLSGAGIANGLAAGAWQAQERFAVPGLSWALRLIPLGIWYLADGSGRSLAWLAVGLGMADLLRSGVMLGGWHFIRTDGAAPATMTIKSLVSSYGAVIIAAAVNGLNPLIDRMIANLGGDGAISIIETGERIYMMLASLATIGISTALLPHLSRQVSSDTLARNWPSVIKFIGGWSLSWILAGWLAGRYGFQWWLYHATGLTETAASGALWVYWAYLPGLPFFCLALAYVKRLQAQQRWGVMVITSTISVALNIPASLYLFHVWGVPGIALATTGIHAVNSAVLVWAAHRGKIPVVRPS